MIYILNISLLFILNFIFANQLLLHNNYLRNDQSLNVRRYYIVDVYEIVYHIRICLGALQGYHINNMKRWNEEFQELLYKETSPTLAKISGIGVIKPWTLVDFKSPQGMLISYQNEGIEKV